MLIPEEKVQEILERTDIVGLVGSRVELKRAGRSLKGLCPFHGERTPSFHVDPGRKRFKCFGCGAGGDAISFVMKHEGKSFGEAARELAALAGVRLEDAGDDALQREKLAQRRVHQAAVKFYQEQLWDDKSGQLARRFLKGRGLRRGTVETFGLGYAPDAWSQFSARAAKEGMLDLALAAGLVSPRKATADGASTGSRASSGTYDFFRGRLMIPIRNAEGAAVAFGARILAGDDPRKFINSRESAIYKKTELLYAIDQAGAAIRKSGQALLVEGYFDAILLHQAGLTNAVALCSASLTAEQVKLLRRFEAKELVLILDGDDAGRRGVSRAAGALLAAAMPTRVVVLPQGVDPDDHVLKIGGPAFKALVAEAIPLTEHLIRSALPERTAASFEGRLKGLEELRPILSQVPEGLERALFIRTLAERLGLPEATLLSHLVPNKPKPSTPGRVVPASATASSSPRSNAPAGGRPSAPPAAPPKPPPSARLVPEEALLFAHLLRDPELARRPETAELEALVHPGLRAAAAAVIEAVIDGLPLEPPALLAALEAGIRRQVEEFQTRVSRQSAPAHRDEYLQRCALHQAHLARAEQEELQGRLRELGSRIAELKRQGRAGPELEELAAEHLRLTREKQELSRARRPPALH